MNAIRSRLQIVYLLYLLSVAAVTVNATYDWWCFLCAKDVSDGIGQCNYEHPQFLFMYDNELFLRPDDDSHHHDYDMQQSHPHLTWNQWPSYQAQQQSSNNRLQVPNIDQGVITRQNYPYNIGGSSSAILGQEYILPAEPLPPTIHNNPPSSIDDYSENLYGETTIPLLDLVMEQSNNMYEYSADEDLMTRTIEKNAPKKRPKVQRSKSDNPSSTTNLPKRPENSFFLYKKDHFHDIEYSQLQAKDRLARIAAAWHNEPERVKRKYKQMAEITNNEFLEKNPDYKYTPLKRSHSSNKPKNKPEQN